MGGIDELPEAEEAKFDSILALWVSKFPQSSIVVMDTAEFEMEPHYVGARWGLRS